jgi:putative ABC transport system permease protein
MLLNYFKIAWRNITRHKLYTVINVLGLAMGICACLVIYLITAYEFSFDKFHPEEARIFRVVGALQHSTGEKEFLNSTISNVAGIQKLIPEFESTAGFHLYGENVTISQGDEPPKKYGGRVEGGYLPASILTGPDYFKIFKYQWLAGNAATLDEPFKVVLSERSARKYFGSGPLDKMIGKTVIYDDSLSVSVSGIVKDWNEHTDFGFTDFISISTATHSFLKSHIPTDDWNSLSPHQSQAFVKLAKGVSVAKINEDIARFIKTHVKLDPGTNLSMWLQPLDEIHFTTEFHRGDDGDDFRKAYLPTLYTLLAVAIFILIIAAINFINLSTAQSIQRVKEIGIRKVLGGNKKGLFFQFLCETLMLTIIAVILSVTLIKPILSVFSSYVPAGVIFDPFKFPTLIFLVLVTLVTTLLAGFYPASVVSSYMPVLSLKGLDSRKSGGKGNLRKGLIVFQFTISLVFIIGVIVISDQISFMHKTDKGFSTDAIVTLNAVWRDRTGKARVLAEKISHIAGIDKVIVEANPPMGFAHRGGGIEYKGKDDRKFEVSTPFSNEDFVPFYKMKVLAGRNLAHSDSLNEFVINETCVKALGFGLPEEAVGKRITWLGNGKTYPIVGVVANFHEGSFHEPIGPVVIGHMPEYENEIALKLTNKREQAANIKLILSKVGGEWKEIYPEEPFNYSFLNESIARLYDQENKTAWLMNVAMYITISISCMGLFGLALFTAQKRTKEIGIRKILGASVTAIVTMLSRDFIKLVLLAFLIAAPIGWFFMNQWLLGFAFRTSISWRVFMGAGLTATLIALATVSLQAFKAAIANPVKSLRSE